MYRRGLEMEGRYNSKLLILLVAGVGFEPTTFGYEPDELPDCSTPQFEGILERETSFELATSSLEG